MTDVELEDAPPEVPEYVLAPADILHMGMYQGRWSTGHVLAVTGWSRRELGAFLRDEIRMTAPLAARLSRLCADPAEWWGIEDTYLAWRYAGVPRRPAPVPLPAWVARGGNMPVDISVQPAHRGS